MPRQTPVIIPPYAILDPAFCDEWGKPLFAWHANSGKISVGNSGIAYSQGSVKGLRGLTGGVTVVRSQGGVSFPGTAGALVDFGTAPALKLTTAYSMFVQAKPTNATTSSVIMGCSGAIGVTGIGIGLGNTGLVIANCSTGTGARFISSQTYDTTVQTLGCTVIPGTAWAGVYRNGVALTNGTGQATPLVPTFSTNWVFSTAAQPFNGILYAAAMWGRPQPQKLFEILDYDPGRLWWWQGKNHDRSFSIPVGGSTFTKTLTCSSTNTTSSIKRAQVIRSGSSTNAASTVKQGQKIASVSSNHVSTTIKLTQKVMTTSSISVASLVRLINKILSVSSVSVASVIRLIGKTLSAVSVGVTPLLTTLKVKTLILIATCGNSTSMVRSTLKGLVSSSVGVSSTTKFISKSLSASSVSVASGLKTISKTLSASSLAVSILSTLKIIGVASTTMLVSIGRGFADIVSRMGMRSDSDGGSGDSILHSGSRSDNNSGNGDGSTRGGGKA